MSEPLLNYYDYEVLCNKLPIHEIHIKDDDTTQKKYKAVDTQTNFLSKRSLDMCIRLEAVEGPRPKYFF